MVVEGGKVEILKKKHFIGPARAGISLFYFLIHYIRLSENRWFSVKLLFFFSCSVVLLSQVEAWSEIFK